MHARTKEFSQRFPGNSLSLPLVICHLHLCEIIFSNEFGGGSAAVLNSTRCKISIDRSIDRYSPFLSRSFIYIKIFEQKRNEMKGNVSVSLKLLWQMFKSGLHTSGCRFVDIVPLFFRSLTLVFFLYIYSSVYSPPISNFDFIYYSFLKFLKINIDNVRYNKFSSNCVYSTSLSNLSSLFKKKKKKQKGGNSIIRRSRKIRKISSYL